MSVDLPIDRSMRSMIDSNNLCGWPWWKKLLFPFDWCEAENKARAFKWHEDLEIARQHGTAPPPPPNTLIMKGM
jgi:hypothetical protein